MRCVYCQGQRRHSCVLLVRTEWRSGFRNKAEWGPDKTGPGQNSVQAANCYFTTVVHHSNGGCKSGSRGPVGRIIAI